MKSFIVGTAGHIDHGKTALIKALTGIDADRLKEEKERGITIDLGFASLLTPEAQIGFIDVPGHERFISNMLAGVGGVHYLLLVIAADESVMAQTREHFDICRLLGIRQGAVVITKIDLLEPDTLPLVRDEIAELVMGSFLENAPVFLVSSRTGEGIEALKDHLIRTGVDVASRLENGSARLPIDRVFSMKGFGTVVTGTLLSGAFCKDQEVEILPGGLTTRIRNLQSYGEMLPEVSAGRRVAINLHRVAVADLQRGMVVIEKNCYSETQHMEVRLELLPQNSARLRDRDRVHLHLGTEEILARVILFAKKEMAPGDTQPVRLRMEKPIVAIHGDRFIVRSFSPVVTIGGGMVLHPFPPKIGRGKKHPLMEVQGFEHLRPEEKILQDLEWMGSNGRSEAQISKIFGYSPAFRRDCLLSLRQGGSILWPLGSENRAMAQTAMAETKKKILEALQSYHRQLPLSEGWSKEELCQSLFYSPQTEAFTAALHELQEEKKVLVRENTLGLFEHRVVFSEEEMTIKMRLESLFRRQALQPPRWEEVLQEIRESEEQVKYFYQLLLKEGRLVRIQPEIALHREVLQEAIDKMRQAFEIGKPFTIGEFKDVLGLTRKVAIPLLEYFDRQLLTRRMAEHRILNAPMQKVTRPASKEADSPNPNG